MRSRPVTLATLAALAVLAVLACGDQGPPVWAPSPVPRGSEMPGCPHARELRARARTLLDEGRLDRAARALSRAEDLCPPEGPATWAPRVTALAILGRSAEALQLAARIDRSDRATEVDRGAAAGARALAEEHAQAVAAAGNRRDDPELFDPAEKKRDAAAVLVRDGARAVRDGDAAAAKRLFLEAWKTWHPNPRALVEAGLCAEALGQHAEAQTLWDRAAYDDSAVAIRPELPAGAPRALAAARVAWSGRRIAVAGDDEVVIYDDVLRPLLHVPRDAMPTAMAFAGGDELLALGQKDGEIDIVDTVLGARVRALRSHAPGKAPALPAVALGFRADGARFAWAQENDEVVVADAASGAVERTFRVRGGPVRGLAFADEGLVVVTARERLRFDLAPLPGGAPRPRPPKTLARAPAPALCAVAGGWVAVEAGGGISVGPVDQAKPLAVLPATGHGGTLAFALAPDGQSLAAVYRDRTLAVMAARDGGDRRELGPPAPLTAFAAAPTGQVLALAAEDGRVLVWNVAEARLRALSASGARALAFSPDGRTLAIGAEHRIDLRDLVADRPGGAVDAAGRVDSLAFSADGMRLAAGTDAPSVQIFAAGGHEATHELHLEAAPVRAVRFSEDGRALLLAPREGVVRWDPEAHKAVRFVAYGPEPRDVVFTPGGMAVASKQGELLLGKATEAAPGPTETVLVASQALALAVAGDGTLATAEGDRAIGLRTPSGKVWQRFSAGDAFVAAVAFLPQGLVAAGSGDGTLRLFRPQVTGAVAVLRPVPGARPGAVAGVVWSPGGHLEVVGPDAAAARDFIRCRLGRALYPFEVCSDQFEMKGLLPLIVAGQDPAEADP